VGADEALTLAMVRTLLDRAHLATPGQLPEVVREAAREVGWGATVYVADYDQRLLVPALVGNGRVSDPLLIDSSLGGRCFRTVQPIQMGGEVPGVWVPLLDGTERLGVIELVVPEGTDLDAPEFKERCRLLGHLSGHLIAAKRPYGDGLDHLMRRRARTVASELLHQLLPPLTFGCDGLVISAFLQPCYDVAADAFDYSVVEGNAHLAILDATGHDLQGSALAAVALSAYRKSRREGGRVFANAQAIDEFVALHGRGWRFATGVLAELELESGRLRYIIAGHPAPLLMRDGKVVKELNDGRRALFGWGEGEATVAEEWLEPGDRVVLYTDGITEARSSEGQFFGLPRLVDHLERAAASQQPAPETLRRISHAIHDHQEGVLSDDATILIAEWEGGGEGVLASSSTGSDAVEELVPGGAERDIPRV
jgi:hypothetical protein